MSKEVVCEMRDHSLETGPIVTFHRLHYCVQDSRFCRKRGPEKSILKDVSGIMRPGMNAIMGATGSDKTSLLDVIAGRKDPRGLKEGQVLVDGRVVTSELRLSSAYVVQDDILMGTLSVRENLLFSANLRLDPSEHTRKDKETGSVQSSYAACPEGRGNGVVSGWSSSPLPSLLFLDEPTTGLDSNTANCIISLLHKLSRRGKTVIFSIHQPRYSIFRQFDHLTLMHKGEMVYVGAASQAMDYFTNLGFTIEAFNNPADFFMDITNGETKSALAPFNTENGHTFLAQTYRQSLQGRAVLEELDRSDQNLPLGGKSPDKSVGYATSFLYQMKVVCKRTVLNLLRNPQTSYAQLALNIFFAVLVGLIYFQMPMTLPEAIQNRSGAFFFLIINMVFGNLSAVELFINERVIFIHENSSGYYRTSVYFLSKIFADLLPNRIIPIVVFSAIAYYMMGLKPDFAAFVCFALNMCLVSLAGVGLAFLVSASVSTFAMANIMIALPFVFMMVFGGFLVNLNSMLSWLSWLKWLSIFSYGLNDLDYSAWGYWQNEVALMGIMLVCMFFAYIQLRRINRWK
ncbi:hypothetical protein NQD34_000711 [Periophthalmus magnuspinnatus]|nr:hypothetical protein NQD34_000711 [Periophthalmus magnuspinnatus]